MGTTVTPIWDLNNPIGTESLGTLPIWNPTNPVGTDTLNSSTINPNNPAAPDWWDRNMPSSKQVQDALGALGKGSGGGAAAGKGAGPVMPDMKGGGAGVGRPTVQSLGPLLQLLNQRRDLLLQSATGGVGAGAPQGAKPTAGLLGF